MSAPGFQDLLGSRNPSDESPLTPRQSEIPSLTLLLLFQLPLFLLRLNAHMSLAPCPLNVRLPIRL
eukprot:3344713-Amphidinium_carterae.1